jgi:chaperonin GroES
MAKKKAGVGIEPLADRVLVRLEAVEDKERKLDSGIILPGTVKGDRDSAKRGTVVAVGPGKYDEGKRVPLGVEEGDTVLFSWGDQLSIEGEEYYLVNESNILAIVK